QVAKILDHPDGKTLLEKMGSKIPMLDPGRLQKWTGLKASQIDHVAVGVRPGEWALTLVIRTQGPYNLKELTAALGDAKDTPYRNKPSYRLQQTVPSRMLWCADSRTMVVVINLMGGVTLADLDKLPKEPRNGAAGLPDPVRQVLENHLDKESVLWVAGEPG